MRLVLALAAAVAAVAALAGPGADVAFACSCDSVVPPRDLPHFDAAFVGTPLSHRTDQASVLWTFDVERAVKGGFVTRSWSGRPSEAVPAASKWSEGERIGLLVRADGIGADCVTIPRPTNRFSAIRPTPTNWPGSHFLVRVCSARQEAAGRGGRSQSAQADSQRWRSSRSSSANAPSARRRRRSTPARSRSRPASSRSARSRPARYSSSEMSWKVEMCLPRMRSSTVSRSTVSRWVRRVSETSLETGGPEFLFELVRRRKALLVARFERREVRPEEVALEVGVVEGREREAAAGLEHAHDLREAAAAGRPAGARASWSRARTRRP